MLRALGRWTMCATGVGPAAQCQQQACHRQQGGGSGYFAGVAGCQHATHPQPTTHCWPSALLPIPIPHSVLVLPAVSYNVCTTLVNWLYVISFSPSTLFMEDVCQKVHLL